jgi:uncharacterized Zn-binding protein involved in type VI secretion
MGAAATRIGDKCSGHGNFPPAPWSHGSTTVFINGLGAVRSHVSADLPGDSRDTHTNGSDTHHAHVDAGDASTTVYVEGRPLVRIGDHLTWSNPPDSDSGTHSCTSFVAIGSGNVFCG